MFPKLGEIFSYKRFRWPMTKGIGWGHFPTFVLPIRHFQLRGRWMNFKYTFKNISNECHNQNTKHIILIVVRFKNIVDDKITLKMQMEALCSNERKTGLLVTDISQFLLGFLI